MSVVTPGAVFRTFPATTSGVDGAPVEPGDTSITLSSSQLSTIVNTVLGKLPILYDLNSIEESD